MAHEDKRPARATGEAAARAPAAVAVEAHQLDGADVDQGRIFELLLDHVCVAGFDGYWKRLNPSWTRTLGWSTAELMSRPLIDFVHPDDREVTLGARAGLHLGEPLLSLTNRYRRKDGSYCWFEWKSVADMERQLVYAVARDVTAEKQARQEQERLQQQLVLADRMASVGTLAAGVAHEINNPLAYVMANLEVLLDELGSADPAALAARTDEWATMVREARQGADRIRRIVRGLKTFSRAGDERRAIVEIEPVLELSVTMAFNEIRHRARLVKDYRGTPRVEADDSRLGQVLINLLVNAAQAVSEGDSEGNEIGIATFTDEGGNAVIEVSDTGPGMPAAVLARVFDPFFTTKPVGVGTGLGLAICHTIVTGLGGQITARNRPEGGAVFRVTLPPAQAAPTAETAGPAASGAAVSRRASVLVVDDERRVGVSLRRLLREHEVTAVTSGQDALAQLDAGARYDLILSDLMMPGMSGMELYERLCQRHPALAERVVFMTGGAFSAAANAFLDRVANERLEKPFEAAQLRALVTRFASAAARDGS